MKLLGRNKDNFGADNFGADNSDADDDGAEITETGATGTTAPKGRPTPKRGQKRGPVAPAPMTSAEARARRKELRGPKTKEERKAERLARRADMDSRRARMMAGEEAYLLPRDQGPVKRYVREIVDSRRNVLGLFMPSALAMVFFMMALPQPRLQGYLSIAMLVLMVVMGIDGVLIARRVNKKVDAKFPDSIESHWKIGFYAASRASQLRKMRVPRPQVGHGTKVD